MGQEVIKESWKKAYFNSYLNNLIAYILYRVISSNIYIYIYVSKKENINTSHGLPKNRLRKHTCYS